MGIEGLPELIIFGTVTVDDKKLDFCMGSIVKGSTILSAHGHTLPCSKLF